MGAYLPRMDASRSTAAAAAMVVGGVLATVLFVPFTIAHGPTSVNLEREVGGWDMHTWGLLMGTIPPLLISSGLWALRPTLAGESVTARRALTVMCVAMVLFAVMNSAFGAMGPPFDVFVLAPASVVVALAISRRGRARVLLVTLAAAYVIGLALSLVPAEFYDRYDGYRVFGIVVYAGVGALWAALGTVLLLEEREGDELSQA